MILTIMILIILLLIFFVYANKKKLVEPFMDQTMIPSPQPAGLSWEFSSPKSSIKNFNETTLINQDLNQLQAQNSQMIDKNQPLPNWVYPYTYVNRQFDRILFTLVHKIEKDFNKNMRLHDRNNQEWRQPYKYQQSTWDQTDVRVKNYIIDVINEINQRFNMDIPIVGFRQNNIQYYWINNSDVIIKIKVYKKYTIEDIKYFEAIDPNINEHLKFDFEKDLIIYIDEIDGKGGYHVKYLRFPKIDYEKDDIWDDMYYFKEFDDLFYLAKSKDPMYRMLSNTESRDLYIEKLKKDIDVSKYTCFPNKLNTRSMSQQLKDQTDCELVNGIWEKKCEQDTDCPYFRSNKNYPNDFGQCNQSTGYCKMPLGVSPLTYRKPSNPQDAYCYNCDNGFLGKGSIGQCCQQQKDKDYMFLDDLYQRRKNQEILKDKNLNWSIYV